MDLPRHEPAAKTLSWQQRVSSRLQCPVFCIQQVQRLQLREVRAGFEAVDVPLELRLDPLLVDHAVG